LRELSIVIFLVPVTAKEINSRCLSQVHTEMKNVDKICVSDCCGRGFGRLARTSAGAASH
ncbi:MAG TPA: hypothetical protein VF783_19545, partial [Terriglobales bacterium]